MIDDFYVPQLFDAKVGDAAVDDCLVAYCLEKAGSSSKRILDIGAGTGRLAIPMLRAGHKVICIDQSAPMLDALQDNAARECAPSPTTLEICHRPFGGRRSEAPVDLAFALDDFLLHLTTYNQLTNFFEQLRGWLQPSAKFITDVRPRSASDLMRQSCTPVNVRTFGLINNNHAPRELQRYGMIFWEQYDPANRKLTTTCQYQLIADSGVVESTFYRVLNQRVHADKEIELAAERSGFELVKHSMQSRNGVSKKCDIGGIFEFRQRLSKTP